MSRTCILILILFSFKDRVLSVSGSTRDSWGNPYTPPPLNATLA